jgi:hypothetical protein
VGMCYDTMIQLFVLSPDDYGQSQNDFMRVFLLLRKLVRKGEYRKNALPKLKNNHGKTPWHKKGIVQQCSIST